ncbi:hypothetical protein DL96DRAFT_1811766 [Flagelloscypha sp. PMI_526]|nr:hypothetical protein DL96DRAFT_1811766 [Flagelloscypha sp. PMI_526]
MGNWPHLKPIAKALSKNLSQDPVLQSPFCARTYALALGPMCSSDVLRQAMEANDNTLLDLIQGYFKLLLRTTNPDPQLEKQLFLSACTCESTIRCLPPEFHMMNFSSGSLYEISIGLRGEEMGTIDNMPSFFEVLADLLDKVIGFGILPLRRTQPKARAWKRQLKAFIRENAKPLAAMMTAWLRRSSSVFVFTFFGTLMDLEGNTFFSELRLLPDFIKAFDYRLHEMVKGGHETQPRSGTDQWLRLDFVFHGAGGFAGAFRDSLQVKSQKDAARSCISLCAKTLHASVCELLTFGTKASRFVQDGTVADLPRLAIFARDLCEISKQQEPPLVSAIISKHMPADDDVLELYRIFSQLLTFRNKCYSSTSHTASDAFKSRTTFQIVQRDHIPKAERLQACTRCKVAYYCCKEHQVQDWKHGTPPHKYLCPMIGKMKEIEDKNKGRVGLEGLRSWEADCRRLELPQEVRRQVFLYIIEMLSYFSETSEEDWARASISS